MICPVVAEVAFKAASKRGFTSASSVVLDEEESFHRQVMLNSDAIL